MTVLRVVADTNLLVSGFLWEGAPAALLNEVQQQRVKLLTTEILLEELEDVLSRAKFAKNFAKADLTASIAIAQFRAVALPVMPADVPIGVIRDDDDRAVLACAVGGGANYIVSGDRHLLELNKYAGIPIVNVNQFLDILENASA